MLEGLPAVLYADSHEPVPQTLYLSPNAEAILGAGADEHLRDPDMWTRSVHPDDVEPLMQAWTEAYETGQPFIHDYRFRRPDEVTIWLREHSVPVRDGQGHIVHWQGVMVDVTTQRAAAAEVRASEQRYRELLERLPIFAYAITDEEDFTLLYGSPGDAAVLGYDADGEEWARLRWPDVVHPEDRERALGEWAAAHAAGGPFDLRYRQIGADGRVLWVHDRAIRIAREGEPSYWLGVVLDVTSVHTARQELEESEARRRALMDNLPAVVYEMAHDDERRTLYVSPHIEELLGYGRDEWLEQPDIWVELLHPDDREIELAAHDGAATRDEPWSREYRLIAADGRTVWVRDVARLVPGTHQPTWQGILLDITARRSAEEELRRAHDELEARVADRTADLEEANALMELEIGERRRAEAEARATEERYRRLVEDLPAVVYRWETPDDVTTGSEYVSPKIAEMLGYTSYEWRTEHLWRQRLHPHDRDAVLAAVGRSESTGEPLEIEYRYLAKDGSVVWVFDRATLLRRHPDGSPATFQGVLVDITERKEAQEQAAEAERRFREILEQGPLITFTGRVETFDPPRVVLEYISPRVAELLGYPASDDDPNSWFDRIHPDDAAETAARTLAAWVSGKDWDIGFRMLAADGRVVVLRSRGRCIERDDLGRTVRFTGAMEDVTTETEERAAIDEELAAMRELLATAPAIAWTEVVDAEGSVQLPVHVAADVRGHWLPRGAVRAGGRAAPARDPPRRRRTGSGPRAPPPRTPPKDWWAWSTGSSTPTATSSGSPRARGVSPRSGNARRSGTASRST